MGLPYQLAGNCLFGESSAPHHNYCQISNPKLTESFPYYAKGHPPPEYLMWQDAMRDQMSARSYITDNSQFLDAKFPQIFAGMKSLKLACDELTMASAVNNMHTRPENKLWYLRAQRSNEPKPKQP